MKASDTRGQIVEVADQLFYRQGFTHTSFSTIADAVGISRGNFYHHFKTKDEILDAVIELRLANTQAMLNQWELQSASPEQRIRCYIQILIANWSKIRLYGCPVGTLTTELAKLDHSAQSNAARIFDLFRIWLRKQFVQLGHKSNADQLAMHVIAMSQGVATVASAYQDEKFIKREVKRMSDWLDQLVH